MELSTIAIEKISGNSRIMNLLAAEFACSEATIRRWINKNDRMLTTASALKVIESETGLKHSQLLTKD